MAMSRLGRVVALAAVTLVIGAGLCVFDADDATGLDLCGLLLLPVVGLVVTDPRLLGLLVPVLIPIHLAEPLDRPVPPPRA